MGLLDEVPPGELDAYLLANSGLPGPRANLTLAVRDDPDAQWIVRENRKKKRLPAACR